MVDALCDFKIVYQPWRQYCLFFKFQFLTTYISGMGGPINMKQKEYE